MEKQKKRKKSETITIDGTLDGYNNLHIILGGTTKKSFTAITREDIKNGTISVSVWSMNIDQNDIELAFGMTFHHPLPIPSTKRHRGTASGGGGTNSGSFTMEAPMPGKVIRINANVGDDVVENEPVVVMEAMKMEHSVLAPTSGKLEGIECVVGDFVDDGDVLAVLKVVQDQDDDPLAKSA